MGTSTSLKSSLNSQKALYSLILSLFIFFINNSSYGNEYEEETQTIGIAFSDLGGDFRKLNNWIRKSPKKHLNLDSSKNIKLFDSVLLHLDNPLVTNKDDFKSGIGLSLIKATDSKNSSEIAEYKFLFYFFKIISFNDSGNTITNFTIDGTLSIPITEVPMQVDTDLYRRQVVIKSQFPILYGGSYLRVKFVFPIAHGGFNLSLSRFTTPLYKDAYIGKSTIISKRTKPHYYQGKPFIRILTTDSVQNGWTSIGLHIKQNSKLLRSPDSHGCIRLRDWDLTTMHELLKYGALKFTPTNIHFLDKKELVLHPMDMHTNSFQKIKAFKENGDIVTKRDEDGLTIYERVYEDAFNYSNQWLSSDENLLIEQIIDFNKNYFTPKTKSNNLAPSY